MSPLQRALQAYYASKNQNMLVEIWVNQAPTIILDYDLYKIEYVFYKNRIESKS